MKMKDEIKKKKRENLASIKWTIKEYPKLKTKEDRLKYLKALKRESSYLIMLINMEGN